MLNKELYKKVASYFIYKRGFRLYRKGWLKGNCPNCGREDKFGINIALNRTNCFYCGHNPKPLYLIMELENLANLHEVRKLLGDLRDADYIEPIVKQLENTNVSLPEGYNNIMVGEGIIANMARKYIKSRGFKVDKVAMKGWGYCNTGKYFGYIIMPIYMGGKLVYYNARKFFGSGPKYNNPDIDETGIGKSLIIYNVDALFTYKEVMVMEGLINAETMGDTGISMGGKKISNYQKSTIIKSPVESLIILLDPDAIKESIEFAMSLSYHKQVKLIYWEEDKDVNDLGKKYVKGIINKTNYQSYNDLIRLKNNINDKRSIITY